jgi:hypothetical protein
MASADGTVYEKNRGPQTESIASRMTRFNPGKSWRRVGSS